MIMQKMKKLLSTVYTKPYEIDIVVPTNCTATCMYAMQEGAQFPHELIAPKLTAFSK